MLSEHENKVLCETGAGTPMGELFRRFWQPALLCEELPSPDCDPVALRLLGEDLIAFRDSDGRVGLMEAYCAHRHANLFWGRNEECGLRCTYHGWKYDVTGQCVDMPNEPEESRFKEKIRIAAYPTREAGGIVWTYMGPAELQPPDVPQLEWTRLPDEQRVNTKRLQESNWGQAVEGGLDSSHVAFLHSNLDSEYQKTLSAFDKSPRFFTHETNFGMITAVRSNTPEGEYYWRMVPFLLPSGKIVPSGGDNVGCHFWVPVDDNNVWTFTTTWNANRPLTPEERHRLSGGADAGRSIHAEVDKTTPRWDLHLSNAHQAVWNSRNNYGIDRQDQHTKSFTGIKGFSEQDFSIQESMGRLTPRWTEHLGTTDREIIEFRRIMLDLARELLEGKEPEAAQHPEYYNVRSASFTLSPEVPLDEVFAPERTKARV